MTEPHSAVASNSRLALIAVALAICGSGSMAYYHLGLFVPRMLQARTDVGLGSGYSWGDDFYPVWLTARKARVEHVDLYSPDMTRQIQTGLFGRPLDPRNVPDPPADYRQFAYPVFTDLILWPTASLQFVRLRLLLALLLPVITVASLWLWLRALDWQIAWVWFLVLALLTLTSYPMLEAFFAEQPGLFVGFFFAAAALALRRGRLILAGALCSLTLIKPQVTLLALFYLLLWSFSDKRRARFWQSFLLVTLALVLCSVWIWPHWLHDWIHVLLGYHRYATPPLVFVMFGESVPSYIGAIAVTGLLGAAVFLAWRMRSANAASEDFWFALALMLAIASVTLIPGQAIYDDYVLIPGILLVLRNRRKLLGSTSILRFLFAAGALALLWSWIAASALLIVRPLLSSSLFYSNAVFALPIRDAASLPFVVLALLWLTFRISFVTARA